MGAYGGTAQASKTPCGWSLLSDLNNTGLVDFNDFAHQGQDWRTSGSEKPTDLDRNGFIDFNDLALIVEDWLEQTGWY